MAEMTPEELTLAALIPRTLHFDVAAAASVRGLRDRRRVSTEAMAWQTISQSGSRAAIFASLASAKKTPKGGRNKHFRRPVDPNRIEELCGLMGAIGEQLGLAWTAEQDLQRIRRTPQLRDPFAHVMVQRAWAEMVAHFVLGAAHSLGNLAVRVLVVNQAASDHLNARYPDASAFPRTSTSGPAG